MGHPIENLLNASLFNCVQSRYYRILPIMSCCIQTNLSRAVWGNLLLVSLAGSASGASVAGSSPIDFNRDIQPIFETRCYECHGTKKQKNGFRLDRKQDAFHGGDSGKPAILPGQSSQSPLIQRLTTQDVDEKMPPKGERLSSEQIGRLRAWIDAGAEWPDEVPGVTSKTPPPAGRHWAFQAPVPTVLPSVRNKKWVRNPVDTFVLARLEKEKIKPSPEADRATLIRRLSLDLLGLPPAPMQVDAFAKDKRPDAYERLVDELLASPHFGERWGRHWLDLARYADSEGYQIDRERPYAYVYRNWVIDAVNRDQPFDQFTIEQLAGDLLPNATLEQKIATGFHRNTLMNYEDGVDREEFRCKAKVDRVSTTGTVWLGLTIGCAECHSHKFDPISQREFYQVYAFFNNADEADIPAQLPNGKMAKAQTFQQNTNAAKTFIHVRGDFLRKGDEVKPGVLSALHPFRPRQSRAGASTVAENHRFSSVAGVFGATASQPNASGAAAPKDQRIANHPPPDRLDLAQWLVDPANPLTARVAVNQFWQHLFGRGLVNTPGDFGTRGEAPSHPELLDWLATEFPKRGWSRKAMIKLIVTSATYRQASDARRDLLERDPQNVLLSRQARVRLDSEIIRDNYLAAGGLLNAEIGGPSFRPAMPPDILALGSAGAFAWSDSTGPEKYRRGLYVFAQRTVPYPVSMTFDQANPNETCTQRERSNTPLQALTLLNHGIFVECAQGLARQLSRDKSTDIRPTLESGFQLCLARKPTREELARLKKLYDSELAAARQQPEAAAKLTAGLKPEASRVAEMSALITVAQVLMNLDEFVTRE